MANAVLVITLLEQTILRECKVGTEQALLLYGQYSWTFFIFMVFVIFVPEQIL